MMKSYGKYVTCLGIISFLGFGSICVSAADTEKYLYENNGDGTHCVYVVVDDEEEVVAEREACVYVKERCSLCGSAQADASGHVHEWEYTDNEDGTHTVSCEGCDYSLLEEHVFDEDDVCVFCEADEFEEDIEDEEPEISEICNVKKGIQINWEEIDSAEGYYIYRRQGKAKWRKVKDTAGTAWTDTGAKVNGGKYQYKIVAYRGDRLSEESDVEMIYRLVKKNITSLQETGDKKVRLKWQGNPKANGYEIQYALTKTFKKSKRILASGSKKPEAILSGFTSGKTYYVRIRSYKISGKATYYSDWSNIKTIKTGK